jgi:hypothetical protein
MISAYLTGAAVLGYLISLFRDLSARRDRKVVGKVTVTAE